MASRYEGIYRSQVNPSTAALPGASAEAFGAGVGRGLEAVGAAAERHVLREKDREVRRARQVAAADAGVRLAEITGEVEAEVNQARTTAAAGAEGHADQVRQALQAREGQFLETIADDRVRTLYRERFAEMRERVVARETGWQAGQRAQHQVDSLDRQGDAFARIQATEPDPDALEEALASIAATWEAQELPQDVITKGVEEQSRKAVLAFANAVQLENPTGLIALIDEGALPHLTADDIDTLRRGGMVELRRAEAAEAAKARLAEAETRETIGLIKDKVAAGIQVPEAELAIAQSQAEALGDERLAFDVATARIQEATRKQAETWLPERYDQEINALLGLGDKRTDEQDIQLAYLQSRAPAARRELENNSGAWAARAGDPPPAIDLDDPATIAARVAWSRRVEAATGFAPKPLLRDEVELLQDQLRQGGAPQLNVVRTLRQFGGGAVAAARQVADNELLRVAVTLPDHTARHLVMGPDALKANPRVVEAAEAQEIFNEVSAAIPEATRPGLRAAIAAASRQIYASMMAEAGEAEWNDGAYRMAIHRALGATGQGAGMRGGLHDYNGSTVWLPPAMTRDAFDRSIARADLDAWTRAGGGEAPRYRGGTGRTGRALTVAELRDAELEPADAPGRYYVRIGDGVAWTDAGAPYVLDIAELAP